MNSEICLKGSSSPSLMYNQAELFRARVCRKELVLNCQTTLAVKWVVCLIAACWLANWGLSLKSWQQDSWFLGGQSTMQVTSGQELVTVYKNLKTENNNNKHTHTQKKANVTCANKHLVITILKTGTSPDKTQDWSGTNSQKLTI